MNAFLDKHKTLEWQIFDQRYNIFIFITNLLDSTSFLQLRELINYNILAIIVIIIIFYEH